MLMLTFKVMLYTIHILLFSKLSVADRDLVVMKRSLPMYCSSLSTIQNIPSLW